ncbi:MAG TPA: alkaline phosphatase family protein [Xanthobacteraceae bacterium]|nr:alkaline phosphatase family protein [Xanthobacteraceae bacterium]
MSHVRRFGTLGLLALLTVSIQWQARADDGRSVKKVFVIAMENHNWTQPANQFSGPIQQIFQNPNAPFINSLVNGSAVGISRQVAFAANYHNVLATASGNNPHIHPSEPNYIWAEAGFNFNIFNDADPFVPLGNNQVNNLDNQLHLVGLLTQAGRTWRSYQEDTDLTTVNGKLTNVVLPKNQWTVPLTSFSGNFASGVNQFNGSTQFNYAAKHNPQVFFTDSNGGDDPTPANPLSHNYAPLQQLFVDLANNTVADYNWISPNQFNDQHTALTGGFMGLTGDAANIRQGDNFLSIVVPAIMASRAYRDRGAIIIWWDESEQDTANANPDDLNHTIGEIVISPLAHPNVNGVPFASQVFLTHSSDLRTMQEIFHVTKPLFLGDAVHANDLSSLFAPGAIPHDDEDDN